MKARLDQVLRKKLLANKKKISDDSCFSNVSSTRENIKY